MQRTYKILSLLLDYPDQEIYESLPLIDEMATEDAFLNEDELNDLHLFITACSKLSLEEWQMYYVNIFDMSKKINLYIFDHIYGDSRERGQAMVDLKEMYESRGYELTSNELPDYIPVFLEYLSFLKDEEKTIHLLNEIKAIIEKLHKLTNEEDVFYKYLFNILLSLVNKEVPVNFN